MKKSISVIGAILAVISVTAFTCEAWGDEIRACFKKNNGQLRIVSNSDQCLPSENGPISLYIATPPGPRTLSVNCTAGQKISDALSQARSGDTILIQGTCNEAITLRDSHSGVSLEGVGPAVINSDGAQDAITIVGAQRIRITGLTVQNGGNGLTAALNSAVTITNATFKENGKNGVLVIQNSAIRMTNSEIYDNTVNGVGIVYSSSGVLEANRIRDNSGNGLEVAHSSSVGLSRNTIEDNWLSGVAVTGNSTANFMGGNTIASNAKDALEWRGGISVFMVSHVTLDTGSSGNLPDVVSGNEGHGISVGNNSSAFVKTGTVSGNELNGIWLQLDAVLHLENSFVTNNTNYGVFCEGSRSGYGNFGATLTGNGLGQDNGQCVY